MPGNFLDEFFAEVIEETRNVEGISADVRDLLRTTKRGLLASSVRGDLLAHLTFEHSWFSGFGRSKRRQLASLIRATSFEDAEPLRFVEANLTERARRQAVRKVARKLVASMTEFSEMVKGQNAKRQRGTGDERSSQ